MIYVVISQEDRRVYVELVCSSLENAKNFVDSYLPEHKIELEWEKINNLWHKAYKTPGNRIVFTIYERKLDV